MKFTDDQRGLIMQAIEDTMGEMAKITSEYNKKPHLNQERVIDLFNKKSEEYEKLYYIFKNTAWISYAE